MRVQISVLAATKSQIEFTVIQPTETSSVLVAKLIRQLASKLYFLRLTVALGLKEVLGLNTVIIITADLVTFCLHVCNVMQKFGLFNVEFHVRVD